ncbi:MAG TPA: UDP-3-O-acyl-N-acetylglucosamine deacetylase [Chthonomonadaceae bacterium]|nr:UDP-3-O-acyl-N-acetylglucosamine deacetylase [Chthonomonadaceae bacterium]
MEQQTLAQSFALEGVGMHTGAPCRVVVHPAGPDIGRVFLVGRVRVPARADYVVDTMRSTTLGHEGACIRTVEHLLSALYGCGVDNALIEVTGPEIPILDGSAAPFAEAILAVGLEQQGRAPRALALCECIEVQEGASRLAARPAPALTLDVATEFAEWPEGRACQHGQIGPEWAARYAAEIAPARTFAFHQEVERILAAGLAKGGSLENALVITPPQGFSTALRLPAEWCAHKLLDVIGDLALTDARLALHLDALRPGHRINTLLARRLLTLLDEETQSACAQAKKGDNA